MPASSAHRSLVWLWPLVSLLSAHAQDALFNAAPPPAPSTATPFLPPDSPHLGPVQFSLAANAGTTYDDDVNNSEINREADFISTAGINLGFFWPATDLSALQFGADISYIKYQQYTGNNGLNVAPNSALTYNLKLADVTLSLFDQLSYTRRVNTEAALANIASLPQINNNAGLSSEWDPGHWIFSASYSHANLWADAAESYLNRSSENFVGRAGWRFAEATHAGLEVSDTITSYENTPLYDSQNFSAGGYVDWRILESLLVTVSGGPVFYEPDSSSPGSANTSVNTYYANLAISHQLTDYLSHSLSASRSLQAGLNQGSSYVEQTTASYAISWQMTQRITLSASASYVGGNQPLEQFIYVGPYEYPYFETEKYEQYSEGLAISWKFTDHLGASLNLSHANRTSNLAGRNYSNNSVGLQLNYTF
jgi:hypothetical protein